MKTYERAFDHVLPNRMPIILRLDGNSFSKLTDDLDLKKPFDPKFQDAMYQSVIAVMKYCSGSIIGYTQSDEITILLSNIQQFTTTPFLANRIQKICSLVASVCSVTFSSHFCDTQAHFDCRCFIVPPEEINNTFLWRQQDAFKNAVSSIAYYGLSTKYGRKTAMKILDGKTTDERQEIIFAELGINVNDVPTKDKRGVCIYRENIMVPMTEAMTKHINKLNPNNPIEETVMRSTYKIDNEIPVFSVNTKYITNLYFEETQ